MRFRIQSRESSPSGGHERGVVEGSEAAAEGEGEGEGRGLSPSVGESDSDMERARGGGLDLGFGFWKGKRAQEAGKKKGSRQRS